MSIAIQLLILFSGMCLGASIANAIWLRVFRRHVAQCNDRIARECEYGDKMEQHCRNMIKHAENAFGMVDAYREYLRDKIVIDDPSVPRRPGGQA